MNIGDQKLLVHEFSEELIFDGLAQLLHETRILLIVEHIIFVLVPPVVEVSFDFPFNVNIKQFLVIEILENSEKSSQLVAISIKRVRLHDVDYHFNELSHD